MRIAGFDIARAYAIFGMFIVNFNFSFGSFTDRSFTGRFLNLFVGNSTAIFIILAGMGISLMCHKKQANADEKKKSRSVVLKRSWFLLAMGLLLYSWWPGDILHFYGGYMHIAVLMLFLPKKYYLYVALLAIVIFHVLLVFIPIETAWDFNTFKYSDFWTPLGFLRNTFYNGWNSIFPWIAYFMTGIWLGQLDWQKRSIKRNIFLSGLSLFTVIALLRIIAHQNVFNEFWTGYILSEYFPAYLPFLIITSGFALMVIPICIYIGDKFHDSKLISWLSKTGQMTLSHYVIHITLGMILFAALTGKHYTGFLEDETPTPPVYILIYAISFFVVSVIFSVLWKTRFKNGPLETLMRKWQG